VKLNARYVSIGDFDDLYFQVLFENRHPAADYDPSATEPYLLLQRQFEDDDRGLCYLETRDIDRFAGHYRLRLIEFTPTRLAFEIDRPEGRTVEGHLQALNPTLPPGPAHCSHHFWRGAIRAGAPREPRGRRRSKHASIRWRITITAYLENGGTLEKPRQMAAHASTRTTQLYDRREDRVTLDEVVKINIRG